MKSLPAREVARITEILGHVSGILNQLPLEQYEHTLQVRAEGEAMGVPGRGLVEAHERRSRWANLRAAARDAGNLADHVTRAAAHLQAAIIAAQEEPDEPEPPAPVVELCVVEESDPEPRVEIVPGTLRIRSNLAAERGQGVVAFNESHAKAIRRAYPDANVIIMSDRMEGADDGPESA